MTPEDDLANGDVMLQEFNQDDFKELEVDGVKWSALDGDQGDQEE